MTRAAWIEVERDMRRDVRVIEGRHMGWENWGRWGRGSCEGYELCLGDLLRFSVVANIDRAQWRVSLNTVDIGAYETFDAAIAAAENEARRQMLLAIEHWTVLQSEPKVKRRQGRNRR